MKISTAAIRNRTKFFDGTHNQLSIATSHELIALCDRVDELESLLARPPSITAELAELEQQIRALQAECDGLCSAGFELAGIALALVERLRASLRATP